MIDVKELRIGNNLYVEKKGVKIVAKVSELSENGKIGLTYFATKDKSRIQVLPIELTEDILLKCDLIRSPENHSMYFFPNVGGSVYILMKEREQYSICINDCGDIKHTTRAFKYLHQLQNAFFTIYQKELNAPYSL